MNVSDSAVPSAMLKNPLAAGKRRLVEDRAALIVIDATIVGISHAPRGRRILEALRDRFLGERVRRGRVGARTANALASVVGLTVLHAALDGELGLRTLRGAITRD